MKVLHLVTSLHVGGIQVLLRHVLPRLKARGIDSVIVLTRDSGTLMSEFVRSGFAIRTCLEHGRIEIPWSYRVGKVLRRSAAFTFGLRLLGILLRERPDVLHSHASHDLLLSQLMAARLAKVPYVLNFHNPSLSYLEKAPARTRILGTLLGNSDRVVSVSPAMETAVRKVLGGGRARFSTVTLGVPDPLATGDASAESRARLRRELGLAKDEYVVGSVGRLVPDKDYDTLLAAFARVLATFGDRVRLVLVGDGSMRDHLQARAYSLDAGTVVSLVGLQKDPFRWLDLMDVFVSSSVRESFGLATLEAMACKKAVVATSTDGSRLLTDDGACALLCPVGDDRALAAGIERLLRSPELRSSMGEEARQRYLDRFSVDETAHSLYSLYQQLVPRGGESGA